MHVCSQGESLTSELAADDDGGSAVQGYTLMIRAETWAFYILTHNKAASRWAQPFMPSPGNYKGPL